MQSAFCPILDLFEIYFGPAVLASVVDLNFKEFKKEIVNFSTPGELQFFVLSIIFFLLLIVAVIFLYLRYSGRGQNDYHGFAGSKFIEVDDFQIHYVQEGRGPDVLLVHGIGSSIFCWRFLFRLLVPFYRVTALDLPGFGRSDKRLDKVYTLDEQVSRIKIFLDKLEIHKTFVVAHSMGGALMAWFTYQYPERVRKIAFLSPAFNHKIVRIHILTAYIFTHFTKKFLVTPSLVRWIYYYLAMSRHPSDAKDAAMQYYLPFKNSPEALVIFIRHLEMLKDSRIYSAFSPFKRQAIVLQGDKDKVITRRHLKMFFSYNANVDYYSDPLSGHQLMEENPDFVNEKIRNFFDS